MKLQNSNFPALRSALRRSSPHHRYWLYAIAVVLSAAYFSLTWRYGHSLPWWDEWDLTLDALRGRNNWRWFFRTHLEHRAPLTKFIVYCVGKLANWDWRFVRFANVVLLAASAVFLASCLRRASGVRRAEDGLIILLVLTPLQYESILLFGWSYAPGLAAYCAALGVVLATRKKKSLRAILALTIAILAVLFAAGPVGLGWGSGMIGVLALRSYAFGPSKEKYVGIAATCLLTITTALFVVKTPTILESLPGRSPTAWHTISGTAAFAVNWLGLTTRENLVAGLTLALFAGIGLLRAPNRRSEIILLAAGALVAAALVVYARGNKIPLLVTPRYQTFLAPLGIALYLGLRANGQWNCARLLLVLVVVGQTQAWTFTTRLVAEYHSITLIVEGGLRSGKLTPEQVAHRYQPLYPYFRDELALGKAIATLRSKQVSIFADDWSAKNPIAQFTRR